MHSSPAKFRDSNKRGVLFYGKSISDGYSILELVAVITVLGILSSITFPKIGNLFASLKIDEAKALLNNAAADCLQKYRINPDDADKIDVAIISDQRLKDAGYEISSSKNQCSDLELIPKDPNDPMRFPIGFSVIKGRLIKTATPTSASSINACEAWAGADCVKGTELSDHINLLKEIEEAKNACNNKYQQWLQDGTTPASYKKWDSRADSGCPTRPPITDANKCNSNGCNPGVTVWGLDGKFVGFESEDYDRALEAKYGKACTEWIAERKLTNYTNNPQNKAAELKECGTQKFWFYKGIDTGSQEEFNKLICNDNLENEKLTSGKRTVQGCGSKNYYFCDNKIKESEKDYKECSCDVDKYNKAQEGKNGSFSTTESGATGCGDFWICNKEILNDRESYESKCKQQEPEPKDQEKSSCKSLYNPQSYCDVPMLYGRVACRQYNICMGRL